MRKQTITVNESVIEYWEAGENHARTVILLSGGFGNAYANWHQFMPALAESFHVCAPELPGFGESSALRDLSVTTMMDWVQGFRQALYLDTVVILGASMSALVARCFAAAHPEDVPAVVLVDGGALPQIPPLVQAVAGVPVLGRLVINAFGQAAYNPRALPEIVEQQDALTDDFTKSAVTCTPALVRYATAMLMSRFPDDIMPRVPTLIVWGTRDGFAPVATGEALAQTIPGSVLAEIEDCGHLPQIEAPEAFAFQVTSFLERLSRPPSQDLPGAGLLKPPPDLPV